MVNRAIFFPDLDVVSPMPPKDGVLAYQQIKELIESGAIPSEEPISESQLQPSSLDLRLGSVGYQVRASFLPGKQSTVMGMVDELALQEIDLSVPQVLQKEAVYIFPVLEALNLPPTLMGKANPKSTTGRLDVFARLIVDYAENFDTVPIGYKGNLYVEVAPRSFSVVVHPGSKLNQLRLLRRSRFRSGAGLTAPRSGEPLIFRADGTPGKATIRGGLWFSIELGDRNQQEIIGWKAKHNVPLIDVNKVAYYDPLDFWEPIMSPEKPYLILDVNEFYILRSKERVRVPAAYAAEMIPYDPLVGEFRVHYAGFFDPGFGYGRGEVTGTRAVLEVRLHEVPYLLSDGQRIGRLIYEPLLEIPDKLYGVGSGSSYQFQDLGLGKQFRDLNAHSE